jgi:PucR family transcriptional regulator, purine catabolism regulatory protein
MPLWLDTMLRESALGLSLIAGGEQVRERGPVRWVHISELPDPSQWLQGGELLLTTGYVIGRSARMQRDFVRRLDEAGCVGLGYSMGPDGEPLPELFAESANRGFPLFTIPHNTPLMAITTWIAEYINNERNRALTSAVRMQQDVLWSILHGKGLHGVIGCCAKSMPGFSFLLFDYYGHLLAEHSWDSRLPEPDQMFTMVSKPLRSLERTTMSTGSVHATAAAVRLLEEIEVILVIAGQRGMHEGELLLFEQILTGVALELARHQSFRLERRRRVGELLDDVSAGVLVPSAIPLRLRRLGIEPDKSYQVLCLSRSRAASDDALATVAEDSTDTELPALVGSHDGHLYCVIQSEDATAARHIADAAAAKGWPDVRVGRSIPRTDAQQLPAAMREAHLCVSAPLAVDAPVRDVSNVGVAGLIAGMDPHPAIAGFVAQVLGPLREHDRRDGGQLLETLRVYLRHACRPGPAANDLHVHRHTLSYRLDRIRHLTGRDPRDGGQLLVFGLALEAFDQGLVPL